MKDGHQRLIIAIIVAMVLFGFVVVVLDRKNIGLVISQANWHLVLPALLFTAISFFALTYSFMLVSRAFGIPIKSGELLKIGFISIALGNMLSLPAAPEYALRLLLMKHRGANTRDILAASIFHSYLTSMVLLSLFPIGTLTLTLKGGLPSPLIFVTFATICTVVIVTGTTIMFAPGFRGVLLHGLNSIWHTVTRRNLGQQIVVFNDSLTYGIDIIRSHTYLLLSLIGLIALDWAATLAALLFCFRSVGAIVPLGTLLTGFSGGVIIGFVSFIPGGLGIQEGSMTTIYTILGINLEQSLLAVVIFRLVCYFLPFALSLLFYRRLLQKSGGTPSEPN